MIKPLAKGVDLWDNFSRLERVVKNKLTETLEGESNE